MPNWTENVIALRGSEEKIKKFLSTAIHTEENLSMDELLNKFEEACSRSQVFLSSIRPIPETFLKYDTANSLVEDLAQRYANGEDFAWMGTQVPDYIKELRDCKDSKKIQAAQKRYNKEFKEAVKYQREKYGVVGWYDYNIDIAFGCKWDCELYFSDFQQRTNGEYVLILTCSTPWIYPNLWLIYVKYTFDLRVFLYAREEGIDFLFAAEILGRLFEEWDVKDCDYEPREMEDGEDEDEYWAEIAEAEEEACDLVYSKFQKLIE